MMFTAGSRDVANPTMTQTPITSAAYLLSTVTSCARETRSTSLMTCEGGRQDGWSDDHCGREEGGEEGAITIARAGLAVFSGQKPNMQAKMQPIFL